VSELVAYPGESEIAIQRDIPHRNWYSVDGNPSGSPWYEGTHLGQAVLVHLGRVRELVGSSECWHVELVGSAFAETNRLSLMNVMFGVEPALLWPVES
jgi:hypothetical protein